MCGATARGAACPPHPTSPPAVAGGEEKVAPARFLKRLQASRAGSEPELFNEREQLLHRPRLTPVRLELQVLLEVLLRGGVVLRVHRRETGVVVREREIRLG